MAKEGELFISVLKREQTVRRHSSFGGMTNTQENNKKIVNGEEEENVLEDECDGKFVLPGDKEFGDNHPVST